MNSLMQWDPFKDMASLPSLFRLPSVRAELKQMGEGEWAPAVDLAEDDENFTITADLPDVKKEDMNVSVENGYLTISGERHHESEDEDSKKKYHRIERSYGSYVRRFAVPENVDAEAISASFKDGVLEVKIPKIEPREEKEKVDVEID
jgi:HSP20 family protein